jgi:hypothetical protein
LAVLRVLVSQATVVAFVGFEEVDRFLADAGFAVAAPATDADEEREHGDEEDADTAADATGNGADISLFACAGRGIR